MAGLLLNRFLLYSAILPAVIWSQRCLIIPPNCQLLCPFGYVSGADGCPSCRCYEPCNNRLCQRDEICIVRKEQGEFKGACVTSIDICAPGVPKFQCFVNMCLLSSCMRDTSLKCITDPCGGCHARFFNSSGYDVTSRCSNTKSTTQSLTGPKFGSCPRPLDGFCVDNCERNSDCPDSLLCCDIGCGRICSTPAAAESTTLAPMTPTPPSNKAGVCPSPELARPGSCQNECKVDTDCPSVRKCCNNGCANVCVFPESGTICINLRAAVEQLPERAVLGGWIPTCTPDGRFSQTQCDRSQCWCVEERGLELQQTRNSIGQPNCNGSNNCPRLFCSLTCPHGFQLDLQGCYQCRCRDICEGVLCVNSYESCKVIWARCTGSSCPDYPYVPKCVPNVCPVGPIESPVLCVSTAVCGGNSFCHQVGFMGSGICCASFLGLKLIEGSCPAVMPGAGGVCRLECKTDVDCNGGRKCCYNGCGLSCMAVKPSAGQKLGFCPLVESATGPCLYMCQSDTDCPGVDKCCPVGCARRCLAPYANETALETKRVTDVSGPVCSTVYCNRSCPFGFKSAQNGCKLCECRDLCETVRCADYQDVCVILSNPNCTSGICYPEAMCLLNTCIMGSPLREEQQLTTLQCDSSRPCPRNGWCRQVGLNGIGFCCPFPAQTTPHSGECPYQALVPKQPGSLACGNQCKVDTDCPINRKCCYSPCGYLACITPGVTTVMLPGSKAGSCPIATGSPGGICTQQCYTDLDCPGPRKCCSVGCSTMCLDVGQSANPSATPTVIVPTPSIFPSPTVAVVNGQKIGVCPVVPANVRCATDISDCSNDQQCLGIRKCCFDGCSPKCVYPEISTACLQLRAALEVLGVADATYPNCRTDGSFEPVQCRGSRCWCVSQLGEELEGTANAFGSVPSCSQPRLCPPVNCQLNCPFGYAKDQSGCSMCACRYPCSEITCPYQFQICVMTSAKCLPGYPCASIPSCVVNVCPHDAPVLQPGTLIPVNCTNETDCGQGAFCQSMGMAMGFCCPLPASDKRPGQCPLVAAQTQIGGATCKVDCRADRDCPDANLCCFNGCGLSCANVGINNPTDDTCPYGIGLNITGCQSRCATDANCPSGQKCCGPLSCRLCVIVAPKVPTKIGQCSTVRYNGVPNNICYAAERIPIGCDQDADCMGLKKCCSDACSQKRCRHPAVTTSCFHQQAAAESINSNGGSFNTEGYFPKCKPNGQFDQIQCDNRVCWCVDGEGMEVPGTRVTRSGPPPVCTSPRRCPQVPCNNHCPYGQNVDGTGCEICACYDPCQSVRCPTAFQICRVVQVDCTSPSCIPIAKCVPNVCPNGGEPLKDPSSWLLRRCGDNFDCPASHFCHNFGFETGDGFCCLGKNHRLTQGGTLKLGPCPVRLPSEINDGQCNLACKSDASCAADQRCCYNGCGLSCQLVPKLPDSSVANPFPISTSSPQSTAIYYATTPVARIVSKDPFGLPVPVTTSEPTTTTTQQIQQSNRTEKWGVCPINPISNPGCTAECQADKDCQGLQKCCQFGCGRVCQLPSTTTACNHWLAATSTFKSEWIPRCNSNTGDFDTQQCTKDYCWCTNATDGTEIFGTRIPSIRGRPDCNRPRQCQANCSIFCPNGLKLDPTGCPENGQCRCKNPCVDVTCSSSLEICTTEKVSCLQSPCPPIPKCIKHGCPKGSPLKDPSSDQHILCSNQFENECGRSNYSCKVLSSQRVGFCCPLQEDLILYKIGFCEPGNPNAGISCANNCTQDSQCPGTQKCCSGCCTFPFNSTNCMQYRSAIERITNSSGPQQLAFFPTCDSQSGLFAQVQCSTSTGECWCVDTVSGKEAVGTRSRGQVSTCNSPTTCNIYCSPYLVCPQGLETDARGCPMANCRCRNACENITCSPGSVCTLKEAACVTPPCLSVPHCVRNQCPTLEPLRDNSTQQLSYCQSDFECPLEYGCLSNFCCPGIMRQATTTVSQGIIWWTANSTALPTANIAGMCPNGQPFLDLSGSPISCKPTASCPMVGFSCYTPPAQAMGICCPAISDAANTSQRMAFKLGDANSRLSRDEMMSYLASFGIRQNDLSYFDMTDNGTVILEFRGQKADLYASKLREISDKQGYLTRATNTIQTNTATAGSSPRPIVQSVFVQSDASGQGESSGTKAEVTEKSATTNSALIGLIVACSVFGMLTILAMIAAIIVLQRRKHKREATNKRLVNPAYQTSPYGTTDMNGRLAVLDTTTDTLRAKNGPSGSGTRYGQIPDFYRVGTAKTFM